MTITKEEYDNAKRLRKSFSVIARSFDLYTEFKIECVKKHISIRRGMDEALRDKLKEWQKK
jgi:hypothetical protein